MAFNRLKKALVIIALLFTPLVAFAIPSSVDRTVDHIQPLISTDYIKGLYFTATSTSKASTFPFASTTVTSASTLCLSTDCRSVWPVGGVSSVFGRTGAVTAQSGDYTTAQVIESGNLYFTNTRAQNAITLTTTGSSGASSYLGGVLNIPNYTFTDTVGNWFTPVSYGNATSTTLGFLNGFTSPASSTIAGSFHLGLSNGELAVFGGLVSSGATTTAGIGLTYTGNAFNVNTTQNITTLSNLTSGTVNSASGVLYNTATSTPTVTAPITYSGTLGQFIGGVSGTFACTNASAGVTGCLTGTDYNTFSAKQPAIALGAGTVNSSASNVLYATATSSVTNGTGISFTGTAGALMGGTALTITNSGVTSNVAGTGISVSGATGAVTITNTGVTSLAVTSPITTSGSTGSITVGCASCLTANQTVTLTGAVTGSGTTAITTTFGTAGANTVLGNGTGATAVPTFIATSTLFVGTIGQNAYFSGTGLLTGTSTIFTTLASAVGIGTVVPSAKFDVQGTSTASTGQIADFWKSDGTNVMRIRNDGNLGIGTTSPIAKLSVATAQSTGGSITAGARIFEQDSTAGYGINIGAGNGYAWIQGIQGFQGTNGANNIVLNPIGSNVGIATTTPANKLTIAGDLGFFGTIPVLSACGTSPAIIVGSTDTAGEITEGSISTGCTITFAVAKANAPFCTLSGKAGLVFTYAVSASAITITNVGALSSTNVVYHCVQNNK